MEFTSFWIRTLPLAVKLWPLSMKVSLLKWRDWVEMVLVMEVLLRLVVLPCFLFWADWLPSRKEPTPMSRAKEARAAVTSSRGLRKERLVGSELKELEEMLVVEAVVVGRTEGEEALASELVEEGVLVEVGVVEEEERLVDEELASGELAMVGGVLLALLENWEANMLVGVEEEIGLEVEVVVGSDGRLLSKLSSVWLTAGVGWETGMSREVIGDELGGVEASGVMTLLGRGTSWGLLEKFKCSEVEAALGVGGNCWPSGKTRTGITGDSVGSGVGVGVEVGAELAAGWGEGVMGVVGASVGV